MARQTYRSGNDLIFAMWLIFAKDGSVRMTRTSPGLDRDERAVALEAKLPLALWATPSLSATLTVEADAAPAINLDIATDALRSALGVDVDLRVVQPE